MTQLGRECNCLTFDQLMILVKPESSYSDDSLPVGAEFMLVTGQPTVTILGDRLERDIAKNYWGHSRSTLINRFVQIEGEVEITGPGAAGNLPGAAALIRSGGMSETVTAGTNVVYSPVEEGIPSNTNYFYRGKDLWKVVGARTEFSLMYQSKQYAKLKFRTVGLFAIPEHNETLPTPAAVTDSDPLILNFANTPTATLFAGVDTGGGAWGGGIDIESLEYVMGNELEMIDRPGCYAVQVVDRKPTIKGVMCALPLDELNLWQAARDGVTGPLVLQHGVDAGQIVGINVPEVELDLTQMSDTKLGSNQKGLSWGGYPLASRTVPEMTLTYQ